MKKFMLFAIVMFLGSIASAAVVDSRSSGPRKIILRPTYMDDGTVGYEEVWVDDRPDTVSAIPAVVNAKVIGAEARMSSHAAQVAPRKIASNGRVVLDLNAARTRKH